MSLETCAGCSTRYAVGLAACPNCRSVERTDGPAVEVPLWADTACANTACPVVGVRRRVMLPRPVLGVVELPSLLCARCGWALPLAWPGPVVESDGDSMSPKITRHGGPSNKHDTESAAAAAPEPTPATAADQPEPEPLDVTEDLAGPAEPVVEGGEESSHGSNSSTSTEKPSTTPATSKPTPRKRTRAANRSTPDPTENSSASSPDTSGPETDAPTDDETADGERE